MSNELLDALENTTLSVGEYLELINSLIAPVRVSVAGEVTDLKVLRDWVFFSLKDPEGGELLRAGLHAGVYRRIGVLVEEGMAVRVHGYGKVSSKSGNFGFWVQEIEPVGEGALRRAYELLVAKLREEGLFTRKRPLPSCVAHIGVISSRDGVVLQDLRNNLARRGIRIDFLHSSVEGAQCASDLVSAIEHFSQSKDAPEVLILIRGGGSLESLQGFNNEAVARALHAAPMPVLVGIGHDVDAPIATMVADASVSTPTAVAQVVNSTWDDVVEGVRTASYTLLHVLERGIQRTRHDVLVAGERMHGALSRVLSNFKDLEQRLRYAYRSCEQRIRTGRLELVRCAHTLDTLFARRVQTHSDDVDRHERTLVAYSPLRALSRGYSLVYSAKGTLVRHAKDVQEGESLTVRLSDGTLDTAVTGTHIKEF